MRNESWKWKLTMWPLSKSWLARGTVLIMIRKLIEPHGVDMLAVFKHYLDFLIFHTTLFSIPGVFHIKFCPSVFFFYTALCRKTILPNLIKSLKPIHSRHFVLLQMNVNSPTSSPLSFIYWFKLLPLIVNSLPIPFCPISPLFLLLNTSPFPILNASWSTLTIITCQLFILPLWANHTNASNHSSGLCLLYKRLFQ